MNSTVRRAVVTIAIAGMAAGVLDLCAALITNVWRGGKPSRIIQAIASGILGSSAFNGGWRTVALGVLLHFVIAIGAATVYYIASRFLRFMVRIPWVAGPVFGVLVYFFMNLVVVPLSAVPFKVPFRLALLITGLIVHILCVGLPIALVVNRRS